MQRIMERNFFMQSMVSDYCWVRNIEDVQIGTTEVISHELHFHITWKSTEVNAGKFMTLEEINNIVSAMSWFFGMNANAYIAWRNAYNLCSEIEVNSKVEL